ncbi:hypothetical protein GCM10010478_45790 [Streptomyces erythrogriseus]|uniref:Uncharacterized protein n=2 Tax=Streptomyces griseoincarnatus group TaxID=2867193 RepID=A0ABP6JPX1_9ACTN|nr:hypothetical protein GCM10010265_07520 [Streptomyces griseoincarnatus]GGT78579.1 hypothetical protein GCM10010287_61210 [Streptomyces variabilis]
MSGAKLPATSTAGTSGPRPVPSARTAGSTAAAWLSVKGNGTPRSGDRPGVPGRVGRKAAGAGGPQYSADRGAAVGRPVNRLDEKMVNR